MGAGRKVSQPSFGAFSWLLEKASLISYILKHAENAQHAFSLEQGPTLHLAIPALEALHKAWSARVGRDKYADFTGALSAGINKIVEYYDKTEESPTYVFAMCESGLLNASMIECVTDLLAVLDPSTKGLHLRKYWPAELHQHALVWAEEIVSHTHFLIIC